MIDRVQLRTNEYANPDGSWRSVDQVEVHAMDMWLRKDITDEKRDVMLAMELAERSGVEFNDWRDGVGAPDPLTDKEAEEFGRSFDVFCD